MAQELVAGLQLTNSFVVVADAGALPLASSAFDRAIAIDVLEHLDEPRELLTEARRVLVDRGRLLVTVPALYDRLREGPIGDVVRRVKRRHRYFTGRLGFDDHRRPRELTEWESLFAETGFRVARSRATTLFPPLHRYGVPRFWFTLTPLRRTISALGTLPALRALGQAVMFDLVRC
jgi:SAM-dependent methyltransferase